MQWALIIVLAYLIGAWPIEKWVKKRIHYQTGWYLLFIDIGKGMIVTGASWMAGGLTLACVASVVVVMGDMYSCFRVYQTGEGITVAAGSIMVMSPVLLLIGIGIYLISLFFTRYLFISYFLSTLSVMILALVITTHFLVIFVILCVGTLVIHKQKVNWQRFRRGAEPTYRFQKPYW